MDGLFELLAAPIPILIGGVEYKLTHLTLGQRAELEQRMMAKFPSPLSVVQSLLKEVSGKDRDTLLELAFQETRWGGAPTMAQFDRWVRTYEGAVTKFWFQLRTHHPELTIEHAEALLRQAGYEGIVASRQAEGMPVGNSESRSAGPAENQKPASESAGVASSEQR